MSRLGHWEGLALRIVAGNCPSDLSLGDIPRETLNLLVRKGFLTRTAGERYALTDAGLLAWGKDGALVRRDDRASKVRHP
jgi:hypothetical protein